MQGRSASCNSAATRRGGRCCSPELLYLLKSTRSPTATSRSTSSPLASTAGGTGGTWECTGGRVPGTLLSGTHSSPAAAVACQQEGCQHPSVCSRPSLWGFDDPWLRPGRPLRPSPVPTRASCMPLLLVDASRMPPAVLLSASWGFTSSRSPRGDICARMRVFRKNHGPARHAPRSREQRGSGGCTELNAPWTRPSRSSPQSAPPACACCQLSEPPRAAAGLQRRGSKAAGRFPECSLAARGDRFHAAASLSVLTAEHHQRPGRQPAPCMDFRSPGASRLPPSRAADGLNACLLLLTRMEATEAAQQQVMDAIVRAGVRNDEMQRSQTVFNTRVRQCAAADKDVADRAVHRQGGGGGGGRPNSGIPCPHDLTGIGGAEPGSL